MKSDSFCKTVVATATTTGRNGDVRLCSLEHLILSQMFVKAGCMARWLTLYTCGNGAENA